MTLQIDDQKEEKFVWRRGNAEYKLSRLGLSIKLREYLNAGTHIATLVGSGASFGAVPLMSKTFENFLDEHKKNINLCKLLANFHRLRQPGDFNVVPVGDGFDDGIEIDEYAGKTNIEDFLSWLKYRIEGGICNLGEDEIYRALYEYFVNSVYQNSGSNRLQQQTIESGMGYPSVLEHYMKFIQAIGESRKIVATRVHSNNDLVSLFTTNYDFLHEDALEGSGYLYTDGFNRGLDQKFDVQEFHRRPIDLDNRFRDHLETITPYFRLYKLHGSINWTSEGGVVRRRSVNDVNQEKVLIAPETTKYALTQNAPFSVLFREFANILTVPNTTLLITGFSFADEHVSDIIQQALTRPDFTLIAFIPGYRRINDVKGKAPLEFMNRNSNANAIFIFPDVRENGEKDAGSDSENHLDDTSDADMAQNQNATERLGDEQPMKFADVASLLSGAVVGSVTEITSGENNE
ncbi:SIR2 family protein [Trueperella pyogenes]